MIPCHRRGAAWALALLCAVVPAASAQTLSSGEATRALSVTVYNSDLGLVREERPLELRAGRNDVRYADVAARLDPTSVHLVPAAGGDFRVLEQNFQYDLVSGDRLLERSIGAQVRAVGEKDEVITGTLLSFDGATLVIQARDGVKILNRATLRELSVESIPGGLITKPTLAWTIDSPSGGSRRTRLSYLTGGLSWHAEYVAVVNPDDTGLSLGGWVSIDNRSGATYDNAKLKLVAGDVNRVRREMIAEYGGAMATMREAAPAPQFAERQFFEYHLYDLQRPATLADRETKQISLFDPANVKGVEKKYTFDRQRTWGRGGGAPKVAVTLEFKNTTTAGLGMPLPAGTVRIYKQDEDGSQEFVGEDQINHTPKDETVRLAVGNAFDIVGDHRQLDTRRVSDRVTEMSFEVSLRNRKSEEVTVTVIDHFYGDWDVVTSSHRANKKDATTLEIPVRIPANQEMKVTYTVRQRG